jgi:hypothetical protein
MKSCWRSPSIVKGKINSSMVGVGEGVNVTVGMGEGVTVSLKGAEARVVEEGKAGENG